MNTRGGEEKAKTRETGWPDTWKRQKRRETSGERGRRVAKHLQFSGTFAGNIRAQPLPYEISLEVVYQTWMRDWCVAAASAASLFEKVIIARRYEERRRKEGATFVHNERGRKIPAVHYCSQKYLNNFKRGTSWSGALHSIILRIVSC